MTTKKELRREIKQLRSTLDRRHSQEIRRREEADQEFSEALTSIAWSRDAKVRIIASNGSILWALCTNADVDHNMIDVGDGQMVPGLRDVTLTLHPEPNR